MSASSILTYCTPPHALEKRMRNVSHHEAVLLHFHRRHHATHAPTACSSDASKPASSSESPTHSPPIDLKKTTVERRRSRRLSIVKRGTDAYTALGRLVHPHAPLHPPHARTHPPPKPLQATYPPASPQVDDIHSAVLAPFRTGSMGVAVPGARRLVTGVCVRVNAS